MEVGGVWERDYAFLSLMIRGRKERKKKRKGDIFLFFLPPELIMISIEGEEGLGTTLWEKYLRMVYQKSPLLDVHGWG